jgi:hypothetical protein
MIEYHRVPRSFSDTARRATAVMNGRSTTMFDATQYAAVKADRDRHVAWVDQHAWKYESVCERPQRRQYRDAVARVVRAFAVRFAPVDADAVGKQGRMVVEHRG